MLLSISDTLILAGYFSILLALGVFGMHRYMMVWLLHKYRYAGPPKPEDHVEPPVVTVQLPLFNEMYVCERLIRSVCALDYPKDKLEIQVLDDSTDETVELCSALVDEYRGAGFDIHYLHRTDRTGYKAGALDAGMRVAKGEFIAVFDADFVPAPDFLQATLPWFKDENIGMVQTRWDHINRRHSLVTEAQSVLLDGHFVVEHTARNRSGRFFNFNGTAGVWRRQTIADAGGWQHDTLTEDLDLSYRAQLEGWGFLFLPDFGSPAEVPVDINAFKSQQRRWAKGSIQTAVKLLPRILRSSLPRKIKVESVFHLTANFAYVLMVLLSLLMPLSVFVRYENGLRDVLMVDLPLFAAATFSVTTFYVVSQRELKLAGPRLFYMIPFVLAVGIGLSFNNAWAVIDALSGRQTEFTRTPKYAVDSSNRVWRNKLYRSPASILPLFEIATGVYFVISTWYALDLGPGIIFSVPFLGLFAFGYLYVGITSLFSELFARLRPAPKPVAAEQ